MSNILDTIKWLVPVLIIFILVGLLWRELFYAKPNEIPSPLIGVNVPQFQLPDLIQSQSVFSHNDLKGRVVLLNVWATWCYACGLEHEMLMKINREYHIPIYSIDYKDDPDAAKKLLAANGNPYEMTGNDISGNVAIDFGVYGTPETFVISPQGKIIYRHVGSINQQTWDEVLYPMIKRYGA